MLIEFNVGNFLSFKNNVTLSMVASAIKEHEDINTFSISKKMSLLKSAVLYGANASGKSNLFKAIRFMKYFVIHSSKETQANEKINVEKFKLSNENDKEPCHFEVVFIYDQIPYRYGFRLDSEFIHQEWLFHTPKGQEAMLFSRDHQDIKLGSHFRNEGKGLIDKTRNNALFLSVVAQFNGEIANQVLKWFSQLNIVSGLDDNYLGFTIKQLQDARTKKSILDFLKIADVGIDDITSEQLKLTPEHLPDLLSDELKNRLLNEGNIIQLKSSHKRFNENLEHLDSVSFSFSQNESDGTQKIFALSGPLLDSLQNGKVLIVDELDSRLHPLITRFIIQLYNSFEKNPLNAQLIFATHDTNLLNKSFFRRDQIWFTEKDEYGVTELYSLVEYKIRNDASYEKDYILGKYGAIPFVGNWERVMEQSDGE